MDRAPKDGRTQHTSPQIASSGTTTNPRSGVRAHAHTHTHACAGIPYKSNQQNRARMEEERSANWPEHRRRKGFKYHWKWGRRDCITSGSAEPVECLWWPNNSTLHVVTRDASNRLCMSDRRRIDDSNLARRGGSSRVRGYAKERADGTQSTAVIACR